MAASRNKRWPGVANRARLDSISQAEDIRELVAEARLKIKQRNLDLALILLNQIDKSAHIIALTLQNAPAGPEDVESKSEKSNDTL